MLDHFGIECLSSGVKKVIFVENYHKVLPVLKKNLFNLKINKEFEIIDKDIYSENLFLNFKESLILFF